MLKNILFFLLLSCNFAYCGEISAIIQSQLEDRILEKLMENADSMVIGATENRIYLRPEKIVPTNHGLAFYGSECEEYILPAVFSDDFGCYVNYYRNTEYYCVKCRKTRLADENGRCRYCGNIIAPPEEKIVELLE